ncbi:MULTISPECIES: hypothetical protein [Pandoraea]|uniref:hypothetical protein n=1 Tax=Pandoraea TaxID=93217 RepID=UPI001F5C3E38|nr:MULTISPECIES: hypothetical protein [Pandoraea]MCI3207153.1 hypothetical protein [Pandoraea sp. LA3]MDN4585182.1 hypothetical protein [Pandoraea capi]
MESVSKNNVTTSAPPPAVQVESEARRLSASELTTDLDTVAQAHPDSAPLGDGRARAVLLNNVAAHAASGPDWAVTVEKVKQEVWQAVRNGVAAQEDMTTPASFLALDEEGKKQVVQLTVNWVFTPVDEEAENRFNRFTANADVRLYLKRTVSKADHDKILAVLAKIPGKARHYVELRMKNYGMVAKTYSNIVDQAKDDIWQATTDGMTFNSAAKTPASFWKLSESQKKSVVQDAVGKLPGINKIQIEPRLKSLDGNPDFPSYMKGTLTTWNYNYIMDKLKFHEHYDTRTRIKEIVDRLDMIHG